MLSHNGADQPHNASFADMRNEAWSRRRGRQSIVNRPGFSQAVAIVLTSLGAVALAQATSAKAAEPTVLNAGSARQGDARSANAVSSGANAADDAAVQLAQNTTTGRPGRAAAVAPAPSVEVITVFARRREENVQSVPAAVKVLNGAKLTNLSITSFRDLAQAVPDIQLGSVGDAFGRSAISISIRGVRSVSDGVYTAEFKRDQRTLTGGLYDLQSVQVLKGPQGTLFGANSTSGAILIMPTRPTYQHEGSVEVRGGTYGMYGGTAVINIPLVDQKVALRLAVDGEHHDGYIKGPVRDYDDDNHYGGRLSLRLDPTSTVSSNTVFETWHTSSQGGGANILIGALSCASGPANNAACLYATSLGGLPTFSQAVAAQFANGVRRTNLTDSLPLRGDSALATNTTEIGIGHPLGEAVGDIKLRTIVGGEYLDWSEDGDEDGLVLPITNVYNRGDRIARVSAEIQLQGHGPRVDWTVGGYFERKKEDTVTQTVYEGLTAFSRFINPLGNGASSQTRELSVYGQATARIVAGLSATVGVRYSNVSYWQNRSSIAAGVCSLPAGVPGVNLAICNQYQSAVDATIPYNFGLQYKFSDNLMIYAATRRGFSPGGFNTSANTTSQLKYQPEILTDYEFGVKSTWHFDGATLLANADVFRSNYTNIQRQVVIPFFNGRPGYATLNAAKAIIDGVEAELALNAGRFSANIDGAYINPRYDSFVTSFDGIHKVNLTANHLAQAPSATASAAVNYRFPEIEHVGEFSFNVNVSYQSTVYFQDANGTNPSESNTAPDAFDTQSPYWITNVRLALNHTMGVQNLTAAVWVKNLFDTTYFVYKLNGGGAAAWATGIVGEPRTVGVSLRYKY
jgi:iron complex outermembrane receptor protein